MRATGWLIWLVGWSAAVPLTAEPPGIPPRFQVEDAARPSPPPSALQDEPFRDGRFELQPHDRVVFLGAARVVHAQWNGHFEAILSLAFPEPTIHFRNIAWEGDTVYDRVRDLNFGTLPQQLNFLRATVVFAEFGRAEAVTATRRTPSRPPAVEVKAFAAAYENLIAQILQQTRRVVLVAPPPLEPPVSNLLPDPARGNELLVRFNRATRRLAAQHDLIYVDAFSAVLKATPQPRLTKDGVQLTPEGHTAFAEHVAGLLSLPVKSAAQTAELRHAIVHKNQLWFDYWRPRNWAFLWGDRTNQPFSMDWRPDRPRLFPEEMKQYPPLIEQAEAEIWQQVERLSSR